jgi:hypothetical protein
MIKRLLGTCVLILGVLAFAGSASAGNGNGNANGNGNGGNPVSSDAAPGNSGNAPGQEKKDAPPAAEQVTTTVAAPPAAASEGVKPSNDTAKDTHAAASSNQTKQYGNGQTAGEIAIKNGAPASTVLHGPGNSQPHKASPCSGGHEVDVHALKGRRAGSCGGSQPTPPPSPNPPGDPKNPPGDPKAPVSDPRQPSAHVDVPGPAAQPPAKGEATAKVASSSHGSGNSRGVLALTARSATLPFTGDRLWITALVGLLLIATGAALRQIRTAEAAVESGHEHSNRARHPARGSRPSLGGRSGR